MPNKSPNSEIPYTSRECLADPHLGIWLVHDAFDVDMAQRVMDEVYASGHLEPVWNNVESSVNQLFRRLIIDETQPHNFPATEQLGHQTAERVVDETSDLFPAARGFHVDEAAVQVYPAGAELALGWHKDHPADKYFVLSAILAGRGTVSFTDKGPKEIIKEADLTAAVETGPGDVLVFRANGLYVRPDGSDIRETHAVTQIAPGEDRFSIQYRMGVNAHVYGNIPINHANYRSAEARGLVV